MVYVVILVALRTLSINCSINLTLPGMHMKIGGLLAVYTANLHVRKHAVPYRLGGAILPFS
jgi:hypothetical protein